MIKNHAQCITNTKTTQQLDKTLAGFIDSTFLYICQAAWATGMTRSMIHHHMKGGLLKHEAQHHRWQLFPDDEHILAKWVQCLSATSYAVYHLFIHELEEEIWKPHITVNDQVVDPSLWKVRRHWILWFLARNPILQSKVTKNIEIACKDITEAQLQNWFQEFKRIVDKDRIQLEHIYNMNETGSGFFNWKYWYILGFNIDKQEQNAYIICSVTEKKVY